MYAVERSRKQRRLRPVKPQNCASKMILFPPAHRNKQNGATGDIRKKCAENDFRRAGWIQAVGFLTSKNAEYLPASECRSRNGAGLLPMNRELPGICFGDVQFGQGGRIPIPRTSPAVSACFLQYLIHRQPSFAG
jgi:hypothetical protein